MSTVDANRVILTGENSVIRLSKTDSDSFTTNATFWRILSSPGGPGHVLYLKSELTHSRWRIYADNIAMARWLQSTVLGAINPELLDMTIPVIDAPAEPKPELNFTMPEMVIIDGRSGIGAEVLARLSEALRL